MILIHYLLISVPNPRRMHLNTSMLVLYAACLLYTSLLTGLPFVITEENDPTDEEKAEKITEYFAGLNDIEKTKIYTEILSAVSYTHLDVYKRQG